MLEISPTIPFSIYMAAEDDFAFYQPYAPGLNNVLDASAIEAEKQKAKTQKSTEVAVTDPDGKVVTLDQIMRLCDTLRKDPNALLEPQIGIPPPDDTFHTRARSFPQVDVMLPLLHIEDFMEIWSRSLPYRAYASNDEPIPEAAIMSWPCFWPHLGGSAAWTPGVNNSWFVCQDYLSLLSSQFLYYTGSIGVKVLVATSVDALPEYKYVSLRPAGLAYRQMANNPFTYTPSELDFDSNFGNGTVVTPTSKQPVIEATLPFRSNICWNCVVPDALDGGFDNFSGMLDTNFVANTVNTNVVLQIPNGDLQDALYRKKGTDYFLTVETLLPPAYLWLARGGDWS